MAERDYMHNICDSCINYNCEEHICKLKCSMFTALTEGNCTHFVNNAGRKTMFKRDFYADLLSKTMSNGVTFLFGPRHCGKTFALRQMQQEFENSVYVSAKDLADSEDAMLDLIDDIRKARNQDTGVIYLIDEVTYFYSPETFISKLYEIFNFTDDNSTHAVVTGSQSIALRYWEGKYFCGCCGSIDVDFLSYSEWLRYKDESEPTKNNYLQFVSEVSDFYKFPSLETYLEGCIHETVNSNYKSYTAIFNNDADGLSVDMLLDIMFCALVNIHIGVNYQTFTSSKQLSEQIKHHYREQYSDEIYQRIADVVAQRYINIKHMSSNALHNALVFLYRNGLIGFTWKSTKLEHGYLDADVISNNFPTFSRDKNGNFSKYTQELFESLGIFIRYPMFYVALLQLILGKEAIKSIPNALLGDIVECHTRGLLPMNHQFTFHEPVNDREIDYVNQTYNIALEISVSDKHGVCFNLLQEDYYNILLTETRWDSNDSFRRIPFYWYIYHLSKGGDLAATQLRPLTN